jgi:hypothetical protein
MQALKFSPHAWYLEKQLHLIIFMYHEVTDAIPRCMFECGLVERDGES